MAKITQEQKDEFKIKREAQLPTLVRKPEFFFLYYDPKVAVKEVYQDSVHANSSVEARAHFAKCYNARLLTMRKAKPFSEKEIDKAKKLNW
jgi:hypothetical protein